MVINDLINDGFMFCHIRENSIDYGGVLPESTDNAYFIIRTIRRCILKINGVEHVIEGGRFAYIGPGKKVEFIAGIETDFYLFVFYESFYALSPSDMYLLNSEVFFDETQPFYTRFSFLTDIEFRRKFYKRLVSFKENNDELYYVIAHNTIESLLLDGLYFIKYVRGTYKKDFSKMKVLNQFYFLLNDNYREHRNVTYYSDLLNITSRKLTQLTEEVSGKSAKQIITDKLSDEVMLRLRNTDNTFSEITYDLGFSDESNFTNFVKKNLGRTPTAIRGEKEEVV